MSAAAPVLSKMMNGNTHSCPLCGQHFATDDNLSPIATHMVECGSKFLADADQSLPVKKKREPKRKLPLVGGNSKKKHKSSSGDEPEKVANDSSPKPSKWARMNVEEYDNFLKTVKEGRLERIGEWKGMSKGVLHRCTDKECAREWKPNPMQVLTDDYYCPSCVLHHRNNMDRFEDPRLKWTASVPNTFYVFSMVDPESKTSLIKFGRTQHADAWKRYPAKERKEYQMELLLTLRGCLNKMTAIENWWKQEADEKGYYKRFSVAEFHGLTECIAVSPTILTELLETSKSMK